MREVNAMILGISHEPVRQELQEKGETWRETLS
jgi:hypothetical protein